MPYFQQIPYICNKYTSLTERSEFLLNICFGVWYSSCYEEYAQ